MNLTQLFGDVDDFGQAVLLKWEKQLIGQRQRRFTMSPSEAKDFELNKMAWAR